MKILQTNQSNTMCSTPSEAEADTEDPLVLRAPSKADGAAVAQLIRSCPPLDVNSTYAYLLLTEHFAQTCVVATKGSQVVGFISAYQPPSQEHVLFVWQVAVHSSMRGQRLAVRMLEHLLQRTQCQEVRYIETTVAPDNQASRRMFQRLADQYQTELKELPFFESHHFDDAAQPQTEPLLRIGPIP